MKVDVKFPVGKGEDAAGAGPRKTPRVTREGSSSGVVLLISQENQQARHLDPSSLTEARHLLLKVTRRLSGTPGKTLAEVHLLESHCLVRLP